MAGWPLLKVECKWIIHLVNYSSAVGQSKVKNTLKVNTKYFYNVCGYKRVKYRRWCVR